MPIDDPERIIHQAFWLQAHPCTRQGWLGFRKISDGHVICALHKGVQDGFSWLKVAQPTLPNQKNQERYQFSSRVALYHELVVQISKLTLPGCPPVHVITGWKKPRIFAILPAEKAPIKEKMRRKKKSVRKNLRFMKNEYPFQKAIIRNRVNKSRKKTTKTLGKAKKYIPI